MVYKFRILSGDNPDFIREIEVESDCTFFDLHDAIQSEVVYDNSHLASFFLTDESWEKGREITLLDMGGKFPGNLVMDMTFLKDHLDEKKQKLLYVFDFFTERAFFIELAEIKDKERNRCYPYCTVAKGDPPPQIMLDRKKKSNIFDEEEDVEDKFEDEENIDSDDLEVRFYEDREK